MPRRLLVVGRKACISTALHQDTKNSLGGNSGQVAAEWPRGASVGGTNMWAWMVRSIRTGIHINYEDFVSD